MIHWLDPDRLWFPDARLANREGLVAVGGDFSVERLLLAYRSGLFPWTASPITWWSPDPRAIFDIEGIHISRSLRTELNKGRFEITFDRDFRAVIQACAEVPRSDQGGTWISEEFVEGYEAFHAAGYAHSVEAWLNGQLAGGLYGVAIGGFFAGESMFHLAPNASKVILVRLAQHLASRGFTLFDTQSLTAATAQMGAYEIPRREYLDRLARAIRLPVTFT
jgi:leucyl/phenylalanyl-tRNA--protein transferase